MFDLVELTELVMTHQETVYRRGTDAFHCSGCGAVVLPKHMGRLREATALHMAEVIYAVAQRREVLR